MTCKYKLPQDWSNIKVGYGCYTGKGAYTFKICQIDYELVNKQTKLIDKIKTAECFCKPCYSLKIVRTTRNVL